MGSEKKIQPVSQFMESEVLFFNLIKLGYLILKAI